MTTTSERDELYDYWLEHHVDQAQTGSLVKQAWDEAWRAGMWAGIHENARLGLHVLELKESIAHLEHRLGVAPESDVDETQMVSAYWHTEDHP